MAETIKETSADLALRSYLQQARERQDGVATPSPVREQAMAALQACGFPGARDEAWRYTRITPFLKQQFAPAAMVDTPLRAAGLPAGGALPGYLLVLRNGYPDWQASRLPGQEQLTVTVEEVEEGALIQAREVGAFALLNLMLAPAPVRIEVPRQTVLEAPLWICHLGEVRHEDPVACYPSVTLALGGDAEAQVVECFAGVDEAAEGVGAVNSLLRVELADNARLHHCKLQGEQPGVWHFAAQLVTQAASSRFLSSVLQIGSLSARQDIRIWPQGPATFTELAGIYLARRRQLLDTHLIVEHRPLHGTSRVVYKGVLGGRGRGVFDGLLRVHPGADGTDARLNNGNLLLSPGAEVDSKPELEIYADDVQCAHGTTVGQIDAEQLFYLQSRGITAAAARTMLIEAFVREVSDSLPVADAAGVIAAQVNAALAELEQGA